MLFLGVDVGSLSCDAVLIDQSGQQLAAVVVPTGARNSEAIARATREVLLQSGAAENAVQATVSTGYGRERVPNREAAVTEITCHAKGILALLPQAQLLVDIGGQDSKAILLGESGVVDFAMNDKCAAGTGRFLEAMARALEVDIDELAQLDQGAEGNLSISSMCTVFAESEVVSLIAEGVAQKEIASALNRAIASRNLSLVKRVASQPQSLRIAMSGGVAENGGVVRALSKALGVEIMVPPQPATVGAYGAALIARQRFQ